MIAKLQNISVYTNNNPYNHEINIFFTYLIERII